MLYAYLVVCDGVALFCVVLFPDPCLWQENGSFVDVSKIIYDIHEGGVGVFESTLLVHDVTQISQNVETHPTKL